MGDLFGARAEETLRSVAQLATRMRPQTLDEVVGQPGLLKPGAAFRRMIESGRPVSMILWGPPGTGKTTLARLVAAHTDAAFETLSATSAGVKDVREVLARARQRLETDERRTVLFLDEIHRFNKSQQDSLLPGVEDGVVILVGATTENPFFEVNSPLISRSTIFRLEPLGPSDIEALIERALSDSDRGLGYLGLSIDPAVRSDLAQRTGGDARLALNSLEVAATLAQGRSAATISKEDVEEALQRRIIRYDKTGDQHYDVISAFIKSMRGSDPDAALFWLHLMIGAGEDPEFIARRMIVFASEDVGLADPSALQIAVAAADALAHVGLPEATYNLTEACIYLSTATKSNSVARAISAATEAVATTNSPRVPLHLRSSGGKGYRYPHDHPGSVVEQSYWPEGSEPQILYQPGREGVEGDVAARLEQADRVMKKERR
ncbi:MAG TPA: replication-associated recombination protein A [Acidimicrobiia bacterium]|nr:replication-associated recombination protein A [Acidimicrobiia bacterium]